MKAAMIALKISTGGRLYGTRRLTVGESPPPVLGQKHVAATIGVEPEVINRLLRLKTLTVDVRAGRALRKYKVVKSDDPGALVFQSVRDGKPMSEQNVLKRHIRPAARTLGLPFVNWRCLRTSHAAWLVQAGADPKSVQGQMRHSRISTTIDIYPQIVPAA
jgi:site-specific recombinase XerC